MCKGFSSLPYLFITEKTSHGPKEESIQWDTKIYRNPTTCGFLQLLMSTILTQFNISRSYYPKIPLLSKVLKKSGRNNRLISYQKRRLFGQRIRKTNGDKTDLLSVSPYQILSN